MRRATTSTPKLTLRVIFQSTLSMRRATRETWNYAPPSPRLFQSTLSMRRATGATSSLKRTGLFQSTLSMRRATDGDNDNDSESIISIHALHEESDMADSGYPIGIE